MLPNPAGEIGGKAKIADDCNRGKFTARVQSIANERARAEYLVVGTTENAVAGNCKSEKFSIAGARRKRSVVRANRREQDIGARSRLKYEKPAQDRR